MTPNPFLYKMNHNDEYEPNVFQTVKKRKLDPKEEKQQIDSPFEIKNIKPEVDLHSVKVEINVEKETDNDWEDAEDEDGEVKEGKAIPEIKIKSMNELLEDDKENKKSLDSSSSHSSHTGSLSNQPVSILGPPPAAAPLINLGPRVYFTNNERPQKPKRDEFCFNCKLFGHNRLNCNNSWHHWWPRAYLEKEPWLYRRLRKSNDLRKSNRSAYIKAIQKIEMEAETKELRQDHNRKQSGYGKNLHNLLTEPQKHVNRFDRPILKAFHRLPSQKMPSSYNRCIVKEDLLSNDSLNIIEHLRNQIGLLVLSLNNIEKKQNHPSKTTTIFNSKPNQERKYYYGNCY